MEVLEARRLITLYGDTKSALLNLCSAYTYFTIFDVRKRASLSSYNPGLYFIKIIFLVLSCLFSSLILLETH